MSSLYEQDTEQRRWDAAGKVLSAECGGGDKGPCMAQKVVARTVGDSRNAGMPPNIDLNTIQNRVMLPSSPARAESLRGPS